MNAFFQHFHAVFAVCDSACQDDGIRFAVQGDVHGADLLGYRVDHRVQHRAVGFLSPACAIRNGGNVVRSQMGDEAAFSVEELFYLRQGVFPAVTKFRELIGGK